MRLELQLTEQGHLHLISDSHRPQSRLQRALKQSVGALMLDLLAHGTPPNSSPIFHWLLERAREACTRYLRALRQGKEPTCSISHQQAQQLLDSMPPLRGERPQTKHLIAWHQSLDIALAELPARRGKSAEQWLCALSDGWKQLGMISLHLAENGGDSAEHAPFAFLATFVHQLSSDDKPRHMPLGLAARAYADDKPALLALLNPLQVAAQRSPFLQELISSGGIYKPSAWTARQAYHFLCAVPDIESAGIETRMVKLWNTLPPKVELEVRLDTPKEGTKTNCTARQGLNIHSLLHFSARAALGNQALSDAELEELMAGENGLIRFRGEWVRLDARRLKQLMEQWRTAIRMHSGGIPLLVGLRYLLGKRRDSIPQLPDDDDVRLVAGEAILRALEQFHNSTGNTALQVPETLRATLRPYQLEGAQFLARCTAGGFGACLADDMGLGKSIQVISWLCHLHARGDLSRGAALIIAPASLLGNWQQELHRFAPHLRCCILHPDTLSPAENKLLEHQPHQLLQDCEVALSSYGIATRSSALAQHEISAIVLDEAQAIKNADSQRSKAILRLNSPRRVALSGTPVENRLMELHSLFAFLNNGLLGTATQFRSMLKDIETKGKSDYSGLKKLIRPFLLRRLKNDPKIAPDLPSKTECLHYCHLTPEQAQLYAREVDKMQAVIAEPDPQVRMGLLLPILGQLKQICNHPAQYLGEPILDRERSGKMMAVEQLVRELAAAGEPCLIFSQYRATMEALFDMLQEIYGSSGLMLHGGTPLAQRQGLVEQFQQADGPPYMVLSLKAAGTGLTLTRARHVIHFDRWWNPAVEAQASDRAHRIGQQRAVFIHPIMSRGTIEQNIHKMLANKRDMAEGLLGSGFESHLRNMSAEELMQLVTSPLTI